MLTTETVAGEEHRAAERYANTQPSAVRYCEDYSPLFQFKIGPKKVKDSEFKLFKELIGTLEHIRNWRSDTAKRPERHTRDHLKQTLTTCRMRMGCAASSDSTAWSLIKPTEIKQKIHLCKAKIQNAEDSYTVQQKASRHSFPSTEKQCCFS